jgi:hypothetical protein
MFSYLFHREPEIIADLPSRIQVSDSMPLLLIIKDAHLFPVRIISVTVSWKDRIFLHQQIRSTTDSPFKEFILSVDISDLKAGPHYFTVQIDYEIHGKHKICLADNYRGTNHQPFLVYLADESIPKLDNCFYGDVHYHSIYTSDQVEFGAGLAATSSLARAMGLDFICVTDHSYDLDDQEDNFLKNDPDLKKWRTFLEEVKELNLENNGTLIIPGEEVTVRSSKNKNVHLLVFNSEKFYYGSGDSAEKWLQNQSEHSISEICDDISDQALLFAAHPADKPPLLQRLLLKRDSWYYKDLRLKAIDGIQFINGGDETFIRIGKKLWIRELLDGFHPVVLAGNDAHGNFSRFRQIGIPFLTMREHHYHLFGKWRTGVYTRQSELNTDNLLKAMKSGNCFLTNGPALQLCLKDTSNQYYMGEECNKPTAIYFEVLTSAEYAGISDIKLYTGDLSSREETMIFSNKISGQHYYISKQIPFRTPVVNGYVRMEVTTKKYFQAISSPVWFRR